MTLIAAFRCFTEGYPGVVICADTQETVGNYRVSVDKIAPRAVGEYELVIGGSGYGGLIDDFIETFSRDVGSWPVGLSEQDIRLKIRRALLGFHRNEVALYPAPIEDKRLEFIICIQDNHNVGEKYKKPLQPNIFLWKTDGTSLVTVRDYALMGFEEAIYQHEAKRLYSPQLSLAQGVMLCINLFSTAKATSNYVGGETQLITVRAGGMALMNQSDVRDLEQRTATFNQALAELVLACPDLSIRNDEFQDLLTTFWERVMQMREQYFELAATEELNRSRDDPNYRGKPFPSLPGGMLIARAGDGKPEIIPLDQTEPFLAMAARPPKKPSKPRKPKGQP